MTDSEIASIVRRLDAIENDLDGLGGQIRDVSGKLDAILTREAREALRTEIRAEERAKVLEDLGLDEPSGLHMLRSPGHKPPPRIGLPTPTTPETPTRKHSRSKPSVGDRVLALVETHPAKVLGALVLVLAIVYGVVPQLVELVQVGAQALSADTLAVPVAPAPPLPPPFGPEPTP